MPAILSANTHLLLPSDEALKSSLLRRQSNGAIVAIPTQYAGIDSGPAPGTVAGIVLGSVAGFLFIIWLLWIASTGGGFLRSSRLTEEEVVVSRRRSSRERSHRNNSMRARTEMTSRSPARRGERVIRQERIIRDRSSGPPPPRAPSRIRESVYVDEGRRVDGDDIVEVIEEHSSVGGAPPPRRKKDKRASGGYRSVNGAASSLESY